LRNQKHIYLFKNK